MPTIRSRIVFRRAFPPRSAAGNSEVLIDRILHVVVAGGVDLLRDTVVPDPICRIGLRSASAVVELEEDVNNAICIAPRCLLTGKIARDDRVVYHRVFGDVGRKLWNRRLSEGRKTEKSGSKQVPHRHGLRIIDGKEAIRRLNTEIAEQLLNPPGSHATEFDRLSGLLLFYPTQVDVPICAGDNFYHFQDWLLGNFGSIERLLPFSKGL